MDSDIVTAAGWVIVAKELQGRKSSRHYLAALQTADEALKAASRHVGPGFQVEISAPVDVRHLQRRHMSEGDVFPL